MKGRRLIQIQASIHVRCAKNMDRVVGKGEDESRTFGRTKF